MVERSFANLEPGLSLPFPNRLRALGKVLGEAGRERDLPPGDGGVSSNTSVCPAAVPL